MANVHIAALHDRIDEEHFEMRLHASAIAALQTRVLELEAAVRELRRLAFDEEETPFIEGRRLADQIPPGSRAAARRKSKRRLQS
jgi:hypothetical protein